MDSISSMEQESITTSSSVDYSFTLTALFTPVGRPTESCGVEAESRKLPSSKYKGVVPQPNGRWGAQIYEKHQRVWLGTFNHEDEAAKAYDVAAQRFRGRDAITNFKTKEVDNAETVFLNSHSKSEIVDMLRKHTYNEELQQSRAINTNTFPVKELQTRDGSTKETGFSKSRSQLFEKAVTPSDVGKLNRLVIPKHYAEKHFPLSSSNNTTTTTTITTTIKGVLLNFEDVTGKVWRFRYSYWNSSQSYVLTKGWSRFVKEKHLKAGDVVCFLRSTASDNQLYIDYKQRQPQVQPPSIHVVRLFGVNILNVPNNGGGLCNDEKRRREMEASSFDCHKKRRIIGAL